MESIRNKLGWGLSGALALLLLAALAGVVHGGPLDPTAPPGSTGKNVITSLPFTISQSGSYVVNGNLTCGSCTNSLYGITVSADNVTIDLQGFEIVGPGTQSRGISTASNRHLTVRDGTIRNWASGIFSGNDGLRVDGVNLKNNSSAGISASGGAHSISNCNVEQSSTGIAVGVGSSITNCTVGLSTTAGVSAGDDVTISQVRVIAANSGAGIIAGGRATLDNCVAELGIGATDGISVGNNGIIRGCSARGNGGVQIKAGAASTLENCVADGNNTGAGGIQVGADSVIRGCTATNTGGDEISAGDGSLIEDCTVDGFTGSVAGPGNGIVVGNDSTVRGCNSRFNAGDGIRATGQLNRIEGNRSYNNGSNGFEVVGGGNVCMQNTAGFNTAGNYAIPGGNNCPVITGTSGATNPFANVQ